MHIHRYEVSRVERRAGTCQAGPWSLASARAARRGYSIAADSIGFVATDMPDRRDRVFRDRIAIHSRVPEL